MPHMDSTAAKAEENKTINDDLEPSIPRTSAQVTLRVVSVVMAIIGALVVLGGVLVFWYRDRMGVSEEGMWTVYALGAILLAAGALLLATAVLGLRAADDSSRVGPYRFLCYLVGLVILVAVVWGWGMGMLILFDPIVLLSTITYVLVCSTLADKVDEERRQGVKGETFLRTGRQRTLHLLSEVIIVKGALMATVLLVMAVAAFGSGVESSIIDDLALTDAQVEEGIFVLAVSTVLNLGLGALGIMGSNRPERIGPFMWASLVIFALQLVKVVGGVLTHGEFTAAGVETLLDLVYNGACVYLSWQIRRQPRLDVEGEKRAAAASDSLA